MEEKDREIEQESPENKSTEENEGLSVDDTHHQDSDDDFKDQDDDSLNQQSDFDKELEDESILDNDVKSLKQERQEDGLSQQHRESYATDFSIGSSDENTEKSIVGEGKLNFSSKKLQQSFSVVAASPKNKKIAGVFFLSAMLFVVYYFFLKGDIKDLDSIHEDQKKSAEIKKQEIKNSAVQVTTNVLDNNIANGASDSQQPLPNIMPLKEPTPPDPPPPPAPIAPSIPILPDQTSSSVSADLPMPNIQPSIIKTESDVEKQNALLAKRKASIMVVGGSSGLEEGAKNEKGQGGKKEKKADNSNFLGFGDGNFDSDITLQATSAKRSIATKMNKLGNTIAQGKVIDVVLETAINTDIPGMLRAIVSRDVYSEAGKNILIPKGSRVIGTYNSDVKDAQTRVAIIWNRIIRPDGIDLIVDSLGTDRLGRSGVPGIVDSKFWLRMSTAFLVSYVVPLAANKIANVGNSNVTNSTTQNKDGSVTNTTSGTTNGMTMQNASSEFNDLTKKSLESMLPEKPTITIDQGVKINILVQSDIVFPEGTAGGLMK